MITIKKVEERNIFTTASKKLIVTNSFNKSNKKSVFFLLKGLRPDAHITNNNSNINFSNHRSFHNNKFWKIIITVIITPKSTTMMVALIDH